MVSLWTKLVNPSCSIKVESFTINFGLNRATELFVVRIFLLVLFVSSSRINTSSLYSHTNEPALMSSRAKTPYLFLKNYLRHLKINISLPVSLQNLISKGASSPQLRASITISFVVITCLMCHTKWRSFIRCTYLTWDKCRKDVLESSSLET